MPTFNGLKNQIFSYFVFYGLEMDEVKIFKRYTKIKGAIIAKANNYTQVTIEKL